MSATKTQLPLALSADVFRSDLFTVQPDLGRLWQKEPLHEDTQGD